MNDQPLKPIRIFDPEHIPAYLVEQIKDRDFTVEAFYNYQRLICTSKENNQLVINPFNLLYALVDEEKHVQGFIWGVVDILNGILCINNFSIHRKYCGKGKALELLKEWALNIKNGAKLKKIYWITKKTKYCEKHGFTPSGNVLHEFVEPNEEIKEDGEHTYGPAAQRDRTEPVDDTPATELFELDARGESAARTGSVAELTAAV